MLAGREIGFGGGAVGLFRKALDSVGCALEAGKCGALPDVAVTGMWFGRLHSEQYEFAGCCNVRGAFDVFCKAFFVLHDMVGGHDRQNGVGVVFQRHECRDGNGRSCIAGDGLKNDRVRF